MKITKGLIIADPWIGYILDGSKTWEMRSSGASHRGWFALIRKGTGAVVGVARLIDVGSPLSAGQMVDSFDYHRIPEGMIQSGEVAKWNTPWKLADVCQLDQPVPYSHRNGAVTWVQLDDAATAGIALQLGAPLPHTHAPHSQSVQSGPPVRRPALNDVDEVRIDITQHGRELKIEIEFDDGQPEPVRTVRPVVPPPTGSLIPVEPKAVSASAIGSVVITAGNIANNHIYLRSFIDRFPPDAIGGSNKASAARGVLTIDWGGPEPAVTDLDGSKKFFRARGWIGAFYRLNRAEAGDRVVVEKTGPYRYRVELKKPGCPVGL